MLLILGDAKSGHVRELREAAEPRCDVVTARLDELSGQIACGDRHGHQVILRKADCRAFNAVLVRQLPHGSLEQVVSTMNLLAQLQTDGVRVINPPRGLEIAIDKYLSIAQLHRAGVRVPPTHLCQSVETAMEAFRSLGGDVVLKPLFGGEGRGMMRITEPEVLQRAACVLLNLKSMLCIQRFVPHAGWDYRLLVVGDRMWGIRRHARGDWRTNLHQGAWAEPVELTGQLIDIGQQAARAVGCEIAGVDLLPGDDGMLYVLEVNAIPGWSGLARAVDHDISREVVDYCLAVSCD